MSKYQITLKWMVENYVYEIVNEDKATVLVLRDYLATKEAK